MNLELRYGLPFVCVTLQRGGRSVEVPGVLVDTGSAATVISADRVSALGLELLPDDLLRTMRGVGGIEYVVTKRVDRLILAGSVLDDVAIQVGGVDYGYGIEGILGMDVLTRMGAVIDLTKLTLTVLARLDET